MATSFSLVPSEIRPPPSVNSDDEDSFEVLGNSMSVDIESILSEKDEIIENEILKECEKPLEQLTADGSQPSPIPINIDKLNITKQNSNNPFNTANGDDQKHIEEILEQNRQLHKQITLYNEKMKKMIEHLNKVAEWQKEVQEVYESNKKKFSEAKLHIDNLKFENAKLRNDVEKYKNIKELTENEMLTLKQQIQSAEDRGNDVVATEQLKKEEELAKSGNDQSGDFSQKMLSALEEKLKECERQMQRLEQGNAVLLKKNESLEYSNDLMKTQLKQSEQREKVLNEQIEKLKTEFSQVNNNAEQIIQLQQLLVSAQMKIKDLENELKDTKIILETKQTEMEQAENQLKKLELENDEKFALTEQLELYKSDFEIERKTRLELQQTRDDVVNEMRNVQRRNEQLQEEIELMRRRGFVLHEQFTPAPVAENHEFSVSNRINLLSKRHIKISPPLVRYTCPLCHLRLRSLRLIEEHIESCAGTH